MDALAQIDGPENAFLKNLPATLRVDSYAENLLLREYGAVFVAQGGTIPPDRIVFGDENEVQQFQSRLHVRRASIGGFEMELQRPAMNSLLEAIEAARSVGKSISPRGEDSARRGYDQTVQLWASRVEPALDHWTRLGKISSEIAARIRELAPFEQVAEVLELEKQQIWFAKDLTKSIIYSVAPPGTSQHLSLLAFDVKEFDDPEVRSILASHGWFRTVVSDLPHFTFLGAAEADLADLGLKTVGSVQEAFWIPDI